jgi:hypothetical protein
MSKPKQPKQAIQPVFQPSQGAGTSSSQPAQPTQTTPPPQPSQLLQLQQLAAQRLAAQGIAIPSGTSASIASSAIPASAIPSSATSVIPSAIPSSSIPSSAISASAIPSSAISSSKKAPLPPTKLALLINANTLTMDNMLNQIKTIGALSASDMHSLQLDFDDMLVRVGSDSRNRDVELNRIGQILDDQDWDSVSSVLKTSLTNFKRSINKDIVTSFQHVHPMLNRPLEREIITSQDNFKINKILEGIRVRLNDDMNQENKEADEIKADLGDLQKLRDAIDDSEDEIIKLTNKKQDDEDALDDLNDNYAVFFKNNDEKSDQTNIDRTEKLLVDTKKLMADELKIAVDLESNFELFITKNITKPPEVAEIRKLQKLMDNIADPKNILVMKNMKLALNKAIFNLNIPTLDKPKFIREGMIIAKAHNKILSPNIPAYEKTINDATGNLVIMKKNQKDYFKDKNKFINDIADATFKFKKTKVNIATIKRINKKREKLEIRNVKLLANKQKAIKGLENDNRVLRTRIIHDLNTFAKDNNFRDNTGKLVKFQMQGTHKKGFKNIKRSDMNDKVKKIMDKMLRFKGDTEYSYIRKRGDGKLVDISEELKKLHIDHIDKQLKNSHILPEFDKKMDKFGYTIVQHKMQNELIIDPKHINKQSLFKLVLMISQQKHGHVQDSDGRHLFDITNDKRIIMKTLLELIENSHGVPIHLFIKSDTFGGGSMLMINHSIAHKLLEKHRFF